MRPAVLYIPYTTPSHEQTVDIINFAQHMDIIKHMGLMLKILGLMTVFLAYLVHCSDLPSF